MDAMDTIVTHTSLLPPKPTFVPPLDIAREQASRVLSEANRLDLETTDPLIIAGEFGALEESLRQVLAALDAQDGRHVA